MATKGTNRNSQLKLPSKNLLLCFFVPFVAIIFLVRFNFAFLLYRTLS